MLLCLTALMTAIAGCGAGGYAGGTIESLSTSGMILDAGQAYKVTAYVSGGLPVDWSLSGPSCSGSGCGTLSSPTGTVTTYMAPTGIAAPMGVTITATIAGTSVSKTAPITVNPDPAIGGSPAEGTVGVPYSTTFTTSGGTGALTLTLASGSLPPGLTFNAANGMVMGIPTAQGSYTVSLQVTDSSMVPLTVKAQETFVIGTQPAGPLTLGGTPPAGTTGVAYSTALMASGGVAPYTFSLIAGALPVGLTLNATTGAISGTPTTAGTATFTAQVQDSDGTKTTGVFSIQIVQAGGVLVLSNPPAVTAGVPYTGAIGVSGGTSPYNCVITSGSLPAGLTANGCMISGTTTAVGSFPITVKANDASSPNETVTGPVMVTVDASPLTLTMAMLPNGTVGVPYSATIGVSGGTAPYACTIAAGTLPAGLALSGCTVSGTPTVPGTSNVTVTATDSSNPQESTTGPESITIAPAPLVLANSMLPNGTVGVPYSATIGVSGGTAPYSCSFTAGTLPAGLTLNGCVVSGTPTTQGTSTLTVKATDSSSPQETVSGPESIMISPAPLSLTMATLPNGTVGVAYSANIGVVGGTAPYSCTITSGTLPAGLTLNGCLVSGTPTVAVTANLTVKATDSSNPQLTVSGPESITIQGAPATLTLGNPPNATAGVSYTGTIPVTGGTAPYSCSLTSGTLPTGLTLNSNCTISGTTTVTGPVTVGVKATDSSNPAATTTGTVTFTVNAASPTLTLGNPAAATVQTPYTGTIGVAGGTAPYSCTLNGGTLPAGLTFNSNCTISGTPTTSGTYPLNVTAKDSSTPQGSVTGTVTLTVNPLAPLTLTGALPNATVNVPYTQTLTAMGGLAPYTYAVTAGALPAGLTLNPTTGVISGTPTTVGASSFTVTATDSENPKATASLPLVLLVEYAPAPYTNELKGPYAFLFQGYDDNVAGALNYQTATVGSFTADGLGGISAGELDANHQSSTATGATVSSQEFLGTYTIGADQRGMITITTLKADGTVNATTTYAIAVKAPVSPATITTEGSLIEFDSNQLAGTKGSGTLLAQTSSSFTTGLTGTYAFGINGDTPCLPSCAVGVVAGPVAEVGEFTANGSGAISDGEGDANIATTQLPGEILSGTYGTADANGRVQLSLATSNTPAGVYPTDFAVYMVNGSTAFVMSTDKHSAYILLAGSMQQQTQTTFSNGSMNGAFVGYENSVPNPSLVSTTLQTALNFSTATVFRGVGGSNGNCNITNVNTGGTTALLNELTGLGGSLAGLQSVLGTYTATGATTCTTASNGRGSLAYPPVLNLLGIQLLAAPDPRVYYLTSPNSGYFLETGYAAVGKFEAQTGGPFSEANTFTGSYIFGETPAASAVSTDTSGVITSNGNGNGTATSTEDLNAGVGTINILTLGMTGSETYTAPDATTGVFTLNTTIYLYAINPNRFALVDTSALTTSPSVSLLY